MPNQFICPVCDGVVNIPDGTFVNELLSCGDCGTELEVLSLEPLLMEIAPPCEEDWGE